MSKASVQCQKVMFSNRMRDVLFKSIVAIKNNNCRLLTTMTAPDKIRGDLKDIFLASVDAVLPGKLIERRVEFKFGKFLCFDDQSFAVKDDVYVVGFGKAVMPMAIALERILEGKIKRGIVSVPRGSIAKFSTIQNSRIEFYEGGITNQPDPDSLQTTELIIDLLSSLTETDTVIILISGGGSALLVKPKCTITLDEKQQLCQRLQNAGADITELNTVRIALSAVKGGGLARIAYPSFVIGLVLSDIVGDPIQLIASGPTVYQESCPDCAIQILQKYHLSDDLSEGLKSCLTSSADHPEQFERVNNFIIGNNKLALEEAKLKSSEKGFQSIVLSDSVKGDVRLVSQSYSNLLSSVCDALDGNSTEVQFVAKVTGLEMLSVPEDRAKELWQLLRDHGDEEIFLIAGGEPSVQVRGGGKGGRNQELALSFSVDWSEMIKLNSARRKYDVVMMSVGTDGQDGPTDAAGAFGYPQIGSVILNMRLKLLEAKKLVDKNVESRIELDALDEVKEYQNMILGENKNYIDKDFVETIMRQLDKLELKNVLSSNDSHSFYSRFNKGRDLVRCGITGTNVMDLHFVYVKRKQCCCNDDNVETKSNIFFSHDLYDELLENIVKQA